MKQRKTFKEILFPKIKDDFNFWLFDSIMRDVGILIIIVLQIAILIKLS